MQKKNRRREGPILTPLSVVKRELIISRNEDQTRIAFLENGRLAEYYTERSEERSIVGNVYKGKVTTVLPGLQAAFVDIGLERSGFLHARDVMTETMTVEDFINARQASNTVETLSAEEAEKHESVVRKAYDQRAKSGQALIQNLLKKGDEILVQIEKEPISTKGSRLTGQISIPSRLAVLIPEAEHTGVSHRIADEKERQRLKKILDKVVPKGFGVIARTSAAFTTEKDLKAEIQYMVKLWKKMKNAEKKSSAPELVHEEEGLVERVARDMLAKDDNRIIIDAPKDHPKIKKLLSSILASLKPSIEIYREKVPLFEALNLEPEIERALRPKVWLKCGGYLVVEETEALVVVDVNTGRHVGKGRQDETILKTNLEAAEEIGRQLRLRDLGGIVVLDFIDMRIADHKDMLYREFSKILTRDRAKTSMRRLTDLGLIEMTRKRVRGSLLRNVCEPCPVCMGRGWISSKETLKLKLKRELERAKRLTDEKTFILEVSLYWHTHFGEDELLQQAREQKVKLTIKVNSELRSEEMRLLSPQTNLVVVGGE